MWEEGDEGSEVGEAGAATDGREQQLSKHYDAVFNELMQECKHNAPGARLSARLRATMERLSPAERRAVCGRTREGCAPLFEAARRGNVEVVEYLVHVCDAPLEQRGVYEEPGERSVHSVTPLWAAAVAGRLPVLRALADAGADLDAGSDSGSTPVRSACFMTHLDAVRFLAGRGADLQRPNHNGGTCLINSVQSARLCRFLLERGAAVDARDSQLKTALHYAVQEHRVETARLLLERGADPRLRSRAGDDALRTAGLKGAAAAVQLLARRGRFPPARLADAYELLGATHLDEFDDPAAALAYWRHATALRHARRPPLAKRPARLPRPPPAALPAAEWRSPAELEAVAAAPDADALRDQALLVVHRVLGPDHKDTVFRLMYRGAAYADAFRYQRCVDLWSWALQIRVEKDTLLAADTCHTACALVRLMLDARAGRLERADGVPRHEDVLRAFSLLADSLPEARRLLEARPVHKRQAEAFDRALRCVTHLARLLLDTAAPGDAAQAAALRGRVRALVAADLRSASTGDSLLHLCASQLNVVRSTYFADGGGAGGGAGAGAGAGAGVFPCARTAALLLECGARAHVRNAAGATPLHVAAVPYNFRAPLVLALLAGGAHVDAPNRYGDSPAELLQLARDPRVCVLRHVTLACLAARALLRHPRLAPPPGALPATLQAFLDLHRR